MRYLLLILLLSMGCVEAKDLLIVGAKGCVYCTKIQKHISDSPSIVEKFNVEYVDIAEYPDLKDKLKIKAYPTSFIFDDNDQLISTLQGFNQKTFTEWVKQHE